MGSRFTVVSGSLHEGRMNKILSSVFGATLALATGLAFAQTTEPAKPALEKPAEQNAAKAPAGKVRGGEFTLEKAEAIEHEKVAEKMRLISLKRQEQISKLKQLLDNPDYRKDANRAPKVLHMLAENYWQEQLYQYLQARRTWEQAMDQFDAGTLSEKPAEPVEDYSDSLEYYRKILREFPNYTRFDEVLYYLGKGAMKEGKAKTNIALQKEGVDYLNRLEKNYPKSPWIANSLLAMAEYYFEITLLYYAKVNYEKIISDFPKDQMLNYARYKLAWVYFNLGEIEMAIDNFKLVVAAVSSGHARGVVEFRNQALNDLVVTFAEVPDGWRDARDYFLSVLDEKGAYKKMRALADLYVGQDKVIEAIDLFRHFIEREKTTKNIPEYYAIILDLYKNTNDMPNLDKVTTEVLDYFAPKDTWRIANKDNTDVVTEADGLTEKFVLYLANFYHREAQRLKSRDFYMKAADKYKTYLSRFAESEKAYVVNFYYAEILYDQMKDYAEAGAQYKAVIQRDTKGEFVEDAALGVIYTYEELMVKEGLREDSKGDGIKLVKVDPKLAEAPIPETELHPMEKDYIAAADKYVELLTDLIKDPEIRKKNPKRGEKIPEIMFIAAQTFYKHGKFQDSVKRLKILFEYDSQSKFAAYAVFTLLDCYQRLKQWPRVEEWARKLIDAKNFTVKPRKELEKIVAIAMTENARMLSMEKRFDDAGKEAMRVYEEFKSDKAMASKALFNVAALYESQKRVDKAIETYKRVAKEFPLSEVAPEAVFTIGMIQESQTEFEAAAKTFESMERFKDRKKPTGDDEKAKKDYELIFTQMADAMQNAGLIRDALGDSKGAIEAFRRFVALFPNHNDVPKIYLRIGHVLEQAGDKAGAFKQYQSWLSKKYKDTSMSVEVLVRSGAILKEMDKARNRINASQFFSKALDVFMTIADEKMVKKCKKYAAQARFELADYLYDDFNALKIPPTLKVNVLKKALEAKAEAQQKAEKLFDSVLDFKSGPWSAGALYKIGLLYYQFKEELLNVPAPEGLDPDTENMYFAILEQIAAPVEEKSLRAFERALKLAHEKRVYNEFSKSCAEYASKVNKDTFPVSGDDLVKPDHIKDTLASTSFIRSLRRGDVEVKMIKEATR